MTSTGTADAASQIHPRGRIVVGVDGSEASLSALRTGVDIARRLGCTATGMTAWEPSAAYPGYYSGSVTPEADAHSMLEQASRSIFGEAWPSWYTAVTRQGWAPYALIAESEDAEMLIVGSRGLGGLAGMLLGSTSRYCVEHAHCPTLVIPSADREEHVTDEHSHGVRNSAGTSVE